VIDFCFSSAHDRKPAVGACGFERQLAEGEHRTQSEQCAGFFERAILGRFFGHCGFFFYLLFQLFGDDIPLLDGKFAKDMVKNRLKIVFKAGDVIKGRFKEWVIISLICLQFVF